MPRGGKNSGPETSGPNDRLLKTDEKKIWGKVARTVSPRRRPTGKKAAKPLPPPSGRDEFAAMLRLPPAPRAAERKTPQSLDVNQDKRTRRGRVEIDVQIDLHDLNRERARAALVKAVIRASNQNHKTVLVITGKGLRGEGVLKRNFPEWISQAPIRPLVASYAPAHIKHGGSGAWYVFLKSA